MQRDLWLNVSLAPFAQPVDIYIVAGLPGGGECDRVAIGTGRDSARRQPGDLQPREFAVSPVAHHARVLSA